MNSLLKKTDQNFSNYILSKYLSVYSKSRMNPKKGNAFISISNKNYKESEDRTSIHFELISKADVSDKFFTIVVNKYIPSFCYVIKLLYIIRKYHCKILLMDYNYKTRFPNLEFIQNLNSASKVICFWLETFDQVNVQMRVNPTLKIINYHIVADDPTLRITKYAKCKDFSEKFYFFPLPIFPQKMFSEFKSNKKKYDVCFFGNVEISIHRSERKKYLDFLAANSVNVWGYNSKGRHDLKRPAYREMLRQIGESKIGLNFSNHGQIGAVTNRVIETIVSGTVLFSSSESVLKEFLRPEIDYVVFTDEQELMQKIESLLSDNVRLAEISMAASASIALRYSAEKFVSFIERLK
jgi:hypothetical protein